MKMRSSIRTVALLLCLIVVMGSMQFVSLADDPYEDSVESSKVIKYEMPFYDVGIKRWSNPYITLLYTHGIVGGTGASLFSPNGDVTRAQFVKMIFGLSNDTLGSGGTSFSDVAPGSWYEPYVAWAVNNGVVNGVSPTRFNPNGKITRQDMAVMLYRFTNPTESDFVNPAMVFSDHSKIADYAKTAVSAMQRMGVIGGTANKDGSYRFDPRGNATREQSAKVIGELFCKNNGFTLPAPIAPPSFYVTYYGLDGARYSGLVESYTYDESFTLPTPSKAGYDFLGWTGTGLGSTPVKNVTVKKGSYGDRSYTANWRIYPAQKYVIAKIKDHLKYNYSGTLVSSGYPVYDYNSDSGDLVRFIDEGKAGEIAIACFHYNGNRITAVIMYLTETGTKFDYIYSDYIEDGYNYLNAEGYTYADRFFFQEESGLDFGDDEAFEEHKSKAGSCLWDIVAVLDMFCEEFVPGYGAGSFGLYN